MSDKEKSEITEAVAALLRARLGFIGISKAELARRTGMNREVLRRYLAAERDLPLDPLFTITDALDMDPASLIQEADQIVRRNSQAGGDRN